MKKFGQLLALFYFAVLLVALFMPRKHPEDSLVSPHFLVRFLHEILYYSGTLELVGNFLLLIPVFLLVVSVARSYQLIIAFSICAGISVLAEIGQSFIPGRVSSSQDLLLNIGGAFVTMLILLVSRFTTSEPKTSE